jgi:hypothetical protein
MNNQEYNGKAVRTLSGEFKLNAQEINELHAAMGLVTETVELMDAVAKTRIDTVNVAEELGDILWYLSIFSRDKSIKFDENVVDTNRIGYNSFKDLFYEMSILTGSILDLYKKRAFYGREISQPELIASLNYLFTQVCMACEYIQMPIDRIRQINIEKLETRFPEKFTEAGANVRNLDNERKVLEKVNGNNNSQ